MKLLLITQPDRCVSNGVIKVCSVEYLTTEIELVNFNSWSVHTIIEYLTLGLMSSH